MAFEMFLSVSGLLGSAPLAPELSTTLSASLSSTNSNNSNLQATADATFPAGLCLKRLLILLVFLATAGVGVVLRLYVQVPVDWSTLCLPVNTSIAAGGSLAQVRGAVTIGPAADNVTLAPCENVTTTFGNFHYPFYGLRV